MKEVFERPPAVVIEAEASLADLARQISAAHGEAIEAARTSLDRGMKAGDLLLKVKGALPHGKFGPWVEANCPFSVRTAQAYMRVAIAREKLQAENPETIAEALTSLAGPKAQSTALLPGPADVGPGGEPGGE